MYLYVLGLAFSCCCLTSRLGFSNYLSLLHICPESVCFSVLIFKIKNDFKGIWNEPDFFFLSDILFLSPYKLLQFVGESLGQHQSVDDHDYVRRKQRCSKRSRV